ncbi:hypothetical protein BAE44_0003714 [Dichanthelium oligosanthes]|uniref:Uncharacterized protein n=1 Tax=Dichanthelium oligosanthes TaxID=888268 RepID=A0A1E5WCZ7_9POAL|nr:hypothetical protein BAE44_0003714 [Dichanthelium oligosanthes]
MRLLSASTRMLLRSPSVVSNLVISPGTPRSISTSSFAMSIRMSASLDANASSTAAMTRGWSSDSKLKNGSGVPKCMLLLGAAGGMLCT